MWRARCVPTAKRSSSTRNGCSKVEDRLELFKKLKRKYGETIDAVIAFGEHAAGELDQIENSAEHIEALRKQEAAAQLAAMQ